MSNTFYLVYIIIDIIHFPFVPIYTHPWCHMIIIKIIILYSINEELIHCSPLSDFIGFCTRVRGLIKGYRN